MPKHAATVESPQSAVQHASYGRKLQMAHDDIREDIEALKAEQDKLAKSVDKYRWQDSPATVALRATLDNIAALVQSLSAKSEKVAELEPPAPIEEEE